MSKATPREPLIFIAACLVAVTIGVSAFWGPDLPLVEADASQ
jgi:hypothetical protein